MATWQEIIGGGAITAIFGLGSIVYMNINKRIDKVERKFHLMDEIKQDKELCKMSSEQIDIRLEKIESKFGDIYTKIDEQTRIIVKVDTTLDFLSEKLKN